MQITVQTWDSPGRALVKSKILSGHGTAAIAVCKRMQPDSASHNKFHGCVGPCAKTARVVGKWSTSVKPCKCAP